MGQHIPLTPTPMEIPNRVEDFPHIDLARTALLAGMAWQGGAAVPRGSIARPSDRIDISFETGCLLTSLRTPLLMGYALTIQEVYCFAKPYFRIASQCRCCRTKRLVSLGESHAGDNVIALRCGPMEYHICMGIVARGAEYGAMVLGS